MKLIAHADKNWGIGSNNGLMFKIPKDMKFFRETTTDGVVIMGRRTLESFPGAKPLPKRVNIVISHNKSLEIDGAVVVNSAAEAAAEAGKYPDREVFVIGGAAVYELMLPYCDTALVTKVAAEGKADAFLHDFDADPAWELTEQSAEVEDNGYTLNFCTYTRLYPGE